jgi:beta-glucosidase
MDKIVVVVATGSGEGRDRPSLSLAPGDNAMISTLVAANPGKVVVVVNGPGAVLMPWLEDEGGVGAVVMQWYPGQEMGNALADILWGDTNPSGRLPLTFPRAETDGPLQTPQQYPGVDGNVYYTEKLLIGYRYWDAAALEPLFPFGHGLSYTSFEYSGLSVSGGGGGGAAPVLVTFNVSNSGGVFGKEVPQLYISFPAAAGEPPFQLRDFEVVPLAPGETGQVVFTLDSRAISIWDVETYAWKVVPGTFGVSVGASSRNFRLKGSFTV